MAERLLTERDVLNATGWPSREFLDRRIKSDGFPRPDRRVHGIGDQWREADVDGWMTGKKSVASAGNALLERFTVDA